MKPIVMGAVMALVMLAMLHEPIMAGTVSAASASLGFVLAHIAVASVVVLLAAALPPARRFIVRHRPNAQHVLGMILGAAVSAGVTHLVMHGTGA